MARGVVDVDAVRAVPGEYESVRVVLDVACAVEFCCESFPGTDDSIKSPQKTYLLALNLTSNLTPNLVNEARVGGNRSELHFNGEGDPGVGTSLVDAIKTSFRAQGASFPTTAFGGPNGSLVGFTT